MTELVEVHLIGIPIPLQAQASEHFDELMREFAHLAAGESADDTTVPERLLNLRHALDERFSVFTQMQQDQLASAVERGDASLDLHYRVPVEAGLAAAALDAMLDEADGFCAAGDYLLTLQTPPAALAYRRWLLAQFVDQVAGNPAVSWADWAARLPLEPA